MLSTTQPSNKLRLTPEDLNQRFRIETNQTIGAGTYGKVYKAEERVTSKPVAIKIMRDNYYANPVIATRLFREISLLLILKGHPNLIELEYLTISGVEEQGLEFSLVFELYNTDLNNVIRSDIEITNEHIKHILYQIFCGIYYMHSAKIVHRDLKPNNILINLDDCKITICDLGLARATHIIKAVSSEDEYFITEQPFSQLTQKNMTTTWYRSPELIFDQRAEDSGDIWAIGCIFAELILRSGMFHGDNTPAVLNLIFDLIGTPTSTDCQWIQDSKTRDYLNKLPKKLAQDFKAKFNHADALMINLLQNIFIFIPYLRIKATEALNHPLFQDIINPNDLLTFPLEQHSTENEKYKQAYYEFETALSGSDKNSLKTAKLAVSCTLEAIITMQNAQEKQTLSVASSPPSVTAISLFTQEYTTKKIYRPTMCALSAKPSNTSIR
jgi:serine/threonine protein kinase